jgi:hypothetical protein
MMAVLWGHVWEIVTAQVVVHVVQVTQEFLEHVVKLLQIGQH